MNKITQKQINDAAKDHVRFSIGNQISPEMRKAIEESYKKAVKWYRMSEIESINDKTHPDQTNICSMTNSETLKLYVDNWPEILEWLRVNHKHMYSIYADCITVFCDTKKQKKDLEININAVRSITL